MKPKLLTIFMTIVTLVALGSGLGLAGDLDDGISKFTDGTIAKDDELGEKEPNLSYIMVRSKGKSSGKDVLDANSANMNSAVIGPGSNIKGDIIIIDNSRGDKTQVVK